jgi:UPF0271 protein
MARAAIDLNSDLGEGFGAYRLGEDEELLSVVTSANIACGFHAGDPRTMDATVALCLEKGVALGAHPGYFDLRGFGRREMRADPAEVETDVLYQVGALQAFANARGGRLGHVKPHGALYNQAVSDEALARAIARGIGRASRDLVMVGLATSDAMRSAAAGEGLRYAAEAFADRRYRKDGTLVPRSAKGSVLTEPEEVASQAVAIARDGVVTADSGEAVPLRADTLCLHGDTPHAVVLARAVRDALSEAGIVLRSLSS